MNVRVGEQLDAALWGETVRAAPSAERDCRVGDDVDLALLSCIRVNARGHVDGQNVGVPVGEVVEHLLDLLAQAARATEASEPVDGEAVVLLLHRGTIKDGAAGVAEGLQGRFVGAPPRQPGVHFVAGKCQFSTGVESVAAVAALAHQEHNAGVLAVVFQEVRPGQHCFCRQEDGVGRRFHEFVGFALRVEKRALCRADLFGCVSVQHAPQRRCVTCLARRVEKTNAGPESEQSRYRKSRWRCRAR